MFGVVGLVELVFDFEDFDCWVVGVVSVVFWDLVVV